MHVVNVHERVFLVPAERVGALIDTLASSRDMLWPSDMWPRMEFDRPLGVGAVGGHGPIRYEIEEYRAGHSIRFRFLGPPGFDGFHAFEIVECQPTQTILRHTLEMNTRGAALVSWPIAFRAMHDALIEDALARAEAALGEEPTVIPWSIWVRLLRWVFSGGQARPQRVPTKALNTDAPQAARR